MLEGIAFLAIVTAAITSTFAARAEAQRDAEAQAHEELAEDRLDSRLKDLSGRMDLVELMPVVSQQSLSCSPVFRRLVTTTGRCRGRAGTRRTGANLRVVHVEGSDSTRARRFARRPSDETLLQFFERIGDAYGLVLVLILTTFVVTMTLPEQGWGGRVVAVAVAGLTAIIALTSSDVRLGRVRLAVAAALAAVLAVVLSRAVSSDALLGAAFVVDSLLLAVAAVTILRRVVPSAMVDFRTILGAISVFTLLGLLFGFLFIALGRLVAGDVFAGVSHAQARDYLFFSYTTLTTTGYGNLVPAGDIGQILSVFEMLTGQVFLVTLVAGLVSLWRPGARAGERAAGGDEQRA